MRLMKITNSNKLFVKLRELYAKRLKGFTYSIVGALLNQISHSIIHNSNQLENPRRLFSDKLIASRKEPFNQLRLFPLHAPLES